MATVYWWAAGFSWLSLVIHVDIVASDTKTDSNCLSTGQHRNKNYTRYLDTLLAQNDKYVRGVH